MDGTSFSLKVIALILMTLDHIHAYIGTVAGILLFLAPILLNIVEFSFVANTAFLQTGFGNGLLKFFMIFIPTPMMVEGGFFWILLAVGFYLLHDSVVSQIEVPVSCTKAANYNSIFINIFLTVCQKKRRAFFLFVL